LRELQLRRVLRVLQVWLELLVVLELLDLLECKELKVPPVLQALIKSSRQIFTVHLNASRLHGRQDQWFEYNMSNRSSGKYR
jgi:hypothetical protein